MIKTNKLLAILIIASGVSADEIKFQFKSPSFSGVGTSSHYLTIENQEFNRKEALQKEIEALKQAAEDEANNTTLARFMRNLESRIYAQLSRQLVENLFGENPSSSGSFELSGQLIEYTSDGVNITLTITNLETNEVTTITLPIGDFTF
tara:strand:+ start:991 stop:1437 length:447 start_codon:yes stop_codon:yes gene_type:complete